MNIGVLFPQNEFGNDPGAIRDFAQTAESLGYTHIVAYDHVLGANPDRPGGWTGRYTHKDAFHEPFNLFSFMAAVTQRIGFAPGIIVLPQRQTALVAKQATELDVLSGGRLRLGVGLGWNAVEYEALGKNFRNRARRIEEQIEVLRLLWTRPLVTYSGRYHTISDAGLKPMPVQQPIPIWFGASAAPAMQRAARLGDGWFSTFPSLAAARPALDVLNRTLAEVGRSRADFDIEARIAYGDGVPEAWALQLEEWQDAGATYISFNTMYSGLTTAQEHIAAIGRIAQAVGL
jgi:probable F420-dependent oxidoreductase